MRGNKKIALLSRISLKRRLALAFIFATFFPSLTTFYYILNSYRISLFTILVFASAIVVGWWVVFEVFSSIMSIYHKTEEAILKLEERDQPRLSGVNNEVERLGVVFNMLSARVQESVEELKAVNSRTEELSRTIAQKVQILSSILQANVLFSKGTPAQDTLQFIVERLKEAMKADFVSAIFRKERSGYVKFLAAPAFEQSLCFDRGLCLRHLLLYLRSRQ